MHSAQPSNIEYKLSAAAMGLVACIIALPSIVLIAKLALGASVIVLGFLAVKIVSRVILDIFKVNNTAAQDQASGHASQNPTKQKQAISIAVGAVALLISGVSFLAIAEAGMTAACVAVAILALYECVKKVKLGKDIDENLDKKANMILDCAVSSIDNLITTGCSRVRA